MARRAESSRRELWRQVLVRQRDSGLSIQGFCAREGLAVATFYAWKRRLVREAGDGGRRMPVVHFAPVRVVAEDGCATVSGTLDILLPHARRVRLRGAVDRQQLADVLGVLEARGVEESGRSC